MHKQATAAAVAAAIVVLSGCSREPDAQIASASASASASDSGVTTTYDSCFKSKRLENGQRAIGVEGDLDAAIYCARETGTPLPAEYAASAVEKAARAASAASAN